jgi:hypothetical protein
MEESYERFKMKGDVGSPIHREKWIGRLIERKVRE